MKTLFIVGNISVVLAIIYLACLICIIPETNIYKYNKTARFILSYIFKYLAFASIFLWVVYLFTINWTAAICYLCSLPFILISLFTFLVDDTNTITVKFMGILSFVAFIFFLWTLSSDFTETSEISSEKQVIHISSTSEFSTEGRILIELADFQDANEEDNQTTETAYMYMQYDENEVKDFNLPIYLYIEADEYEIVDDKKDSRIEVTTIKSHKESLLSYFDFTKPTTTSSTSTKIYVHPNNIKYH